MTDSIFGIDRGIIRAFLLMVVIVGVLTTFFLSEYVAAIILGSVFQVANGTTVTTTVVTNEVTIARNDSAQQLVFFPIVNGTLSLANGSGAIGLGNFTINVLNGSLLLKTGVEIANGTSMLADYQYQNATVNQLPVTAATNTFLEDAEADFVTTFTTINTAVKFTAALITVVAVILIFASFLPKRREGKDMDF